MVQLFFVQEQAVLALPLTSCQVSLKEILMTSKIILWFARNNQLILYRRRIYLVHKPKSKSHATGNYPAESLFTPKVSKREAKEK